jgi:NAD(P)-dependent dehydrogenase (short-subunit alcohol dehydrogenase family)
VTRERAGHARVAMATRAASGIGDAVVGGLAGAGWTVVTVDGCADPQDVFCPLSPPANPQAVAARWPGPVQAVVTDARDQEGLTAPGSQAEYEHGDLDAAVAAVAVIGRAKSGGTGRHRLRRRGGTSTFQGCGIWPTSAPTMPRSGPPGGWPLTCAARA